MDRRSPAFSESSSLTSLSQSGSFSPRDSAGPLSPQGAAPDGARPRKVGGGGGIQMQIQHLQDEQERVQKKTFTNWMNTYLKQKTPPLKVENLFEDIKDGVVLLSLLEVLSGEKLPIEKGKLKRVHYVSNLSTALKFLESKKIKLVNINVSDIADGKPSIVLGLIWTIILYFQIEETMSMQVAMPAEEEGGPPKKLSALDKFRMNAKKALLAWTENAITKRYGIEIKDFGKSWRDGLAFNAIVHTIRPDLVDMERVRKQNARVNLENAFSTAENHLGIARLLDPEDVDVAKPDEKSVMTYVAQFLKAYPEAGEDPALGKKIKTPADQEIADYQELMNWLTTEAVEVLEIVEQPVEDRQQEYMDYLAFKAELDRRGNTYGKLEDKVKTGKALKITPEQFKPLAEEWKKISRQTRLWLWKLDASLPGKLGKFGDWLNQAEEILEQEEEILENPEEMATQLGNILEEHKKFFKDLEPHRQFFIQVKRAGRYEGEFIPPPQLENLHNRLQKVCKQVPQRERRLEFEELKYQLLAYLVASESKLQLWTVKYGRQENVEELLADYQDFVHHGNLFKNYDKTYDGCKKKADAYRKANIPHEEVQKMDHYFDEVNSRWKKVSVEIKSVQSMLEEVIESWWRYNACVDLLTVWLSDGEKVMSRSTEEKQEFFTELQQYEEKHKILNEAGNFLIETVEEPVAVEIKQTLLMINRRFKDLVDQFQTFKQVEVIGKARKEYGDGLLRLSQWLKGAEDLLAREVPCKHALLREYLNELDTFNGQIPSVESDFKVTTKTAQSLVKESSQEIVTEMLQSLNVQKEVLVKIRKEIPEKVKALKAMLPNIESLETGLVDLNAWLDNGESLLESHKLDGTQEETEGRLEKHKSFFSEITYQKSIVESKNKVYQKVNQTKPKLKNIDFTLVDQSMDDLNRRFQSCVASAKDWEKKLENLSRLWRVLSQKQQAVENWLDQAQTVLDDCEDDYDSIIRKHKAFFVRIDERMLQDYIRAAKDILAVLDDEDRAALIESMENIQGRWEHIQKFAPIKLIKLEFCVQEEKFVQTVENAEKTINQQQQMLQRRENVKETLQKHKQMFHQGDFQKNCLKCLESMDTLSKELVKQDSRDNSLRDQYDLHLERWNRLKEAMDATLLSLKQLPERWKEYNAKLGDFSQYVETVESLAKKLQDENLTSEEYKDLQAQFQKALKNMNRYADDSKWLKSNLEDLLADSNDSEALKERRRLEEMMARFNNLLPNMDKTSAKSAVFSKAYEFRDGLGKRSSWLDDAQKQVMEQPFIDGLEDARVCLQEHEMLMSKLDSEKNGILADIEAGKKLQKDKNAPLFIAQNIQELENKLKNTNDLAQAKHTKLKKTLKDWEDYEGEKNNLIQYLKKAEAELEKPPSTSGQEMAKKDYSTKKELQNTLNKLKGSLGEVQKLNAILCEGASRERRGPLKGEMTDIDKKLDNVSVRLNAKLADLESTIAKWTEYYKRLNHFCDWLNEKEEKLNEVYEDKTSTPEEQLDQARGISTEVYENHITLENLEKDARGLSQNFRSRETAALKSKLATVRRQWEALCSRAKDRSSALTGSVAHWQMYQNLAQQLMPWIVKAEKYCATELPKCSSMEEAKDLYELHQQFLHECESNLPIFEKMTTEAGYIIDQPNMQKELDTLQRRWNDVLTASEERSHRVDKMQGAWVAYNQEVNNIEEVLEKFENRLAAEPNVNSTDPQVLEHELALCKTLQEEIRSQQPHLNALQRQFEQVKQHATPEGIRDLKEKQDHVKAKWEKVTDDASERQNMLNAALRHRQDFYGRLGEFEKWLKKTQRKLDTGSEIYSDEVAETVQKLKALKAECDENEPLFNALCGEFKVLVQNCNEDEAAILTDRYDRVMGGFTKIEDLLKNREELCNQWESYQGSHRDTQAKLKNLQAKLASPNIKEEEVAAINEEVKALRREMGDWGKQAEALDDLMAAAQLTIKDRATQRTLHFGSEVQALDSMCDSVLFNAKQKEEQLGELSQLWTEFERKKGDLLEKLVGVAKRVDGAVVDQSSLQGVKDLVREIEDVRDDVFAYNPEYEQLRELGRQIMQADPSKGAAVQGNLSSVNEAWDGVQGMLGEKLQQYSTVANLWQQYNDTKQGVMRTLDDVDPLVQQDIAFSSQPEVKKSLDQHKNAEFELHANQTQLDHMNNRGLQLLEDLKNIPNFDVSVLEQDLDSVNHKWETANATIDEHKENLEAQLVCWDQVTSGKEELESWVNTMVTKLDDSLQHFDDAVSVEACLAKYKDEAPYFQEVLNDINQKIGDLKDMNQEQEIPELMAAKQEIEEQFEKASALANQLEGVMANFTDERANLQKEIEEETEWLNKMKEMLGKCDDVSGTDEDLVQRLHNAKAIEEEMEAHKKNIAALLEKTAAMQDRYPSAETANLAKDAVVLNKKFESVLTRGEKIEDMLQGTLEQHATDAQQQRLRWQNAAKEKLAWCGDIAGDRYSVEAKLATIVDLIMGADEGEQKKKLAATKVDALKAVLPKHKQADLDKEKEAAEVEFQDLMVAMKTTQNKLESSIGQWSAYDKNYEELSQWLKDMEGKVRNEASLKQDLPNKIEQFELLKSLEDEVRAHQAEFERLKDTAQDISNSTGDGRTASYAGQLCARYQTLADAVREQVEKCEQNIEDHEGYIAKYKDCTEWIKSQEMALGDCTDTPRDNEALEEKLETIQVLNLNAEQGAALFNSALESGERLYPNTSNEGREAIRRELRSLRDQWEGYNENLNETQRHLQSSKMQWSSFDENYEQLEKWVGDMDRQLEDDMDLKNSLQEKKAALQHYRTRCQDIVSHQSMIDSISDKGSALASTKVKGKLNDLNAKYHTLCGSAQAQVKKAEAYVEQHQKLQDAIQQCRDWMAGAKDKLAVCAEASGDRQALQNRLDKVKDLVKSLREGEAKVKAAHVQGEKCIPQTAPQGQSHIRRDLEALTQDFEALATRMGNTQENLVHALEALTAYDGSCDQLNKWLREMEAMVKDVELKATLGDKQGQVEKLKQCQQDINAHQRQFDELQNMVTQMQGADTRLVNYSSQLNSRYETLKSNMRDLVNRWGDYVRDHQNYQSNYSQCVEWVETLKKRQEVCADMAGDKQDVEDRLTKLQELLAEKEQGASRIHTTVESGERLYPSTAAEGREIIRQELRSLRDQWEQVCDQLSDTQRKLESCLIQWSSYDENYEQLQKWLLDTEVLLKEDTDLKGTLPDKKAQLQNHRVLHQDIMSRQHVVDNLTEKAQMLSQSSPVAKVNKFVDESHKKYDKLCNQSKQMLDKLEVAVKDHQQYQDVYQDCQDWLNSSRDKVEACADTSGDRVSIQNKLERLREFATHIGEGEKKLQQAKELSQKTAKHTSIPGCEVLRREMDHLQSEWQDYISRIKQAEEDLEHALLQWGDFETKFDACSQWLKNMEQQVKNYELKSTLPEKKTQVEKFKKQREEILAHQPDFDRFTDDAQNLMHTSADVRLSTQVSQLTNRYRGLLSLIKDLIGKWDKYAQDHHAYDNRHSEFRNWLTQAEEKLETCQQPAADQDTMEEKKAVIQILLSEKDHGLQRLNAMIEAGEKLYPDTAAHGRETIRQNIRSAKEDWERLFSGLNDTQRRVDSFLLQWTSYSEGQDQLVRWLGDTEATLRADVDLKNTLQEKRMQLQNHRSLLQDISSHQRIVDSVVEKAQGVLQSTSNPDVASFITEINSRYETLAQAAKADIARSEKSVKDHQDHHDALQAAVDWLTLMKDRLSTCSDTTGDRHTLQNKLDRVKELMSSLPEGQVKVQACEKCAEKAMETTALKGRQTIQQELDVLKLDWEDYSVKLTSLEDSLDKAVRHWGQYEDQYGVISQWIKEMERKVKDFPLKSTLEEKQMQFKKYQEREEDLLQEIKSQQRDVDNFSDEAQTLQQLTGETRVASSISQLTSRYQSLQQTVKDAQKKCEQNVNDHKLYKDKAKDCAQWLAKAKDKFADNADTSGTRQELEERLEKIQEIISERDTGFAKLNQAIEAGEKLYPNTATEGREKIRQELRQMKMAWESLFDDLSSAQRKLEVALVQWTTFDDSYGQVEQWLKDAELQLEGQVPLRSTLEEKKTQLQNFKVLHQDVLSYQRVIDSVDDKARTLVQSSSDPQLANFVSQTGSRYEKLCSKAKERVQQYEGFVADHQQYNDAYNQCIEWLNSIREKLSLCADIAGDRHTIQNRLDKIQDILATKMEGEPKVKNIVALAEKVLPNTAPQGKDIIVRETDALRADWEAFVTALQKTKQDLENCMDQWKEFENWYERCNNWLKEVEVKVKDTELKATLKDKQNQLDKLKRLQEELGAKQGDIDALSDAAQDLVRISTDTRVVSQSSQLATKYQTLRVNVKELCRRWEQYVLDHQAYAASFDQCKAWVVSMRKKLATQSDVKGDKRTVQERIEKLKDFMADKEEGMHMLQISLDNLQVVLPNTNVAGRDNMRQEMATLQAEYDALSGDLNDTRNKLDGTLAQWTVYDDSIEQLRRWLNDLENQIHTETQLQNTLQEKKLQLERIKVLQLNIGSQQSTIDNLNEKAQNLQQSSSDPNLSGQIRQIVDKYSKMCTSAKELQANCEKNLKNHQLYRDSYMDTTDWLSATVDKMNSCSDVRGDRTAIEAQLQKILEIQGTLDIGREKLDDTLSRGDLVKQETSKQGQDLIREELTMLTNDFEQFDTDINELQNTLEKLRDEWLVYEEDYEKLNQWIKDTETDMKAESDQKATLEEKSIQLEKQQTVNEEISEKQSEFDALTEHAQVLLQSTTDNRVTSQLTQMSSRYNSLIAASKDYLKRYEQHVQDHQQYAETFTEAVTWLQGTRDKLSVCADTSGDRYTIQTQLEKLQEFVVMKEEGQLLIHTAQSWGEKTMNNTSVDGREMIRQELQQLQQEWDAMIGEVTDTKVMLESCLLQWTDFNDSYEQIQKRLREMEKRLRGTDPKVDLSEKKAELQRIKGLYQDVVSFEQMVESAGVKAQDLMEKSPGSKALTDTSQVMNKYHNLKDLAMDMLAKAELNVAQHTAYHDSCNNFMSWLRTAREKLATCSDTFGEKSTIVGKIERAKALVSSIGEGSQRLADATKAGEATLPNTSPTGQTKIRQEIKSMNKDFEEFRTELMSAQEDLEECLTRWNEFEDSYSGFNNWLKETETYLRSDLELKATVEEKKRHWEQYQQFMEEIQYKQATLDHVNEKAQSLLQTNADAKTSHAITQLTTRYQGVIALSKDIVKNLTIYYNNHLHYKENHDQFQTWLKETKKDLQNIHRTAGSKEDLGSKLDNMAEIQSAMDQGHSLLRQVLECSEKSLPNTNQRGCQTIRHECEAAKIEYENLITDSSQAKRGLESALSQWGDFDRSHEQFHLWLTAMESKVNSDPGCKADLPEKKSSLEKFKALQTDCVAHRELLERLEEKAANVNDAHPQSRVLDLRSRYSAVTAALKELVTKLDSQVAGHEEYRKGYIGCLDWMANTRHRLQRLSDFTGDRRTLEDRLQQLKEFKGEMRHGQDMVNNATQMGERVCLTTAPRGQEAIQKELYTLKEDWSGFVSAVNEVEGNLEATIGNWAELDDELSGFMHWMEKMEGKVKSLNESRADMSKKQRLAKEAEELLDEVVKKKSALEQVRGRGDAVAQRSTDPRLSNNMMQVATKYQALTSAAKNLVQKLGENAKDHKAYNEAFDAATKWLAEMEERVHDCNDTAGDWHTLQDRMDAVKNITASMDEGLQKVNRVCDLAEKILPNTSSEGKRIIEQQVTELTNEWEKLNMSITDCNAMLEGVQERWNDYEEYYGSLVRWLADMENTLGMDPEPKAQLVEKKTQLDKFKLIASDVDNHQRLVNELAERVANLEALSENPEVTDSLQDVQTRYDRVRTRARELINKLDRSYQEHLGFHEAQQESEKWLLQMSFKLMNHNSLNCSTMELTQRQIEKHRQLLREIEEYRSNLDRVNMKGRRLIDNNPKTPRLAQQMQSQLQNLEESYVNLQATAEQIRDRLQDVLRRWQEYRGCLESTDHFLKEEFPHWLKETDNDIPDSMNDAQRKLDGIKGMWDRMSTMKQEINNAANRCENLGSIENLDEVDLPENSAIAPLAESVNHGLRQAMGEVEQRLNDIRDNMSQWDSVDRMRGELRAWLRDKQEEVEEIEQQPSKLHAEAAELDIAKLQGIREEVQTRGPAVEGLLARYRELTDHNPNLNDPIIKAVKDDWEELLGQVENLIEDREQALVAARELQARENEVDEDLEKYINELEKIESADVATVQKSAMMKTRKPCRSTQTPRKSARDPNRSLLLGESDDDNSDDDKFLFPPRGRPGSQGSGWSLKRKRGPHGGPSPRHSRPGSRPGSRFDYLKKGASASGGLDSESEESGYGETYYTMHASSFDNNLDNTEVFEQATVDTTMRGTPMGLDHFSDNESTVSYLSTHGFGVDPEALRDAQSQTPGHTGTQTPANMWDNVRNKPRSMQTQTQSNTSLHSIGNQTRRSSGSRADLLRSILFEVKGLKQQRGLDSSSYQGSEDDANSVVSDNTVKKETLQTVLEDVRTLREADATGTAATQTIANEGTQTSMKLFPEGDPVRNARLEKFKNLMDDVKQMKGSRTGTPSAEFQSRQSSRTATPVERRRITPVKFAPPPGGPVQNGLDHVRQPVYPQQSLNATAPPVMMNAPPVQPFIPGRHLVTQDDLNSISQRLERLQNYVTPRRPPPPPPPPRPEYVIPVYAAPPKPARRRRPPAEDAYLSDESEYGDVEPPRRRRPRESLDRALEEASQSALQLKRLSKKMKDSLRDDMRYDFM